FELFEAQVDAQGRRTSDVAARTGETGSKTQLDGVRRVHHDDGNRSRRTLGAEYDSRMGGDDDIDLETSQLQREVICPFGLSLRVPNVEDHVPTLDISQLVQGLAQGV